MNYPYWDLPQIGGASLIALISIVHVYVAHLAVGGGAFIWLTDLKGAREKNVKIHQYIRKYTWFFLLLTMIFGGVTGVGIWFIIALVHPSATSSLIHYFVFGWAIEWVFFLGEITALLVYHYKFDQLSHRNRHRVAFLYFLFAWLSLFIINGILSFMLTPGKWLVTQNFWHGFLNPTFLPSLLFRTSAAAMIAGLFGYVTVVFEQGASFRRTMLRYCSKWTLFPFLGLVIFGAWYLFSIPKHISTITFNFNPQTIPFVYTLLISSILIFIGGIAALLKAKQSTQKMLTFVLVIIGLAWMGGFEYVREIARKPYVINDFMFSTSVLKSDVDQINQTGLLKYAKWSKIKEINDENRIEAGSELFRLQCSGCHTINGIRNDIIPRTHMFTYMGMLAQLDGQGKVLKYMPRVLGTEEEKKALAAYIVLELNDKELIENPEPSKPIIPETTAIPPFNSRTDQYVLLVWNDLGMHCISDSDPWFVILPPANTLEAQLIRRGTRPEIVTDGVEITYAVQKGFENPSKHVDFWEYADRIFGAKLGKDTGLAGTGMSGAFELDDYTATFVAEKIPVVPYSDNGTYQPYPIFDIEARETESGELLAATKVVAPVSTEMGCRNCHGGDWRWNNTSGLSEETAINILKAHDRINRTDLYDQARKGKPQLCQNCHADPAMGAAGKADLLNLSAALHGWHAHYLAKEGAEACMLCHPSHPTGNTRCSRSVHVKKGIKCTDCHGNFADHAIALLKDQQGRRSAELLLEALEATQVASKEEINPRTPWLKLPDCLSCHVDYDKPGEHPSSFNKWTPGPYALYRNRTDRSGTRCTACHGSPHAEYPATNAYGPNRDNIQPMQYTGEPYPIGSNEKCEVCHIQEMKFEIHHHNLLKMFRNKVSVH
ncbi:cytochrome C [candidate division KSB1 bacterium]|nr:cytochrome C [candidate division KSB1 bacterium]